MPLLDHFHPPLFGTRHWESLHAQWAGCIASALNDILPDDYFAETQVHVGTRVEVDVGTFDTARSGGGVATAPRVQPALAPADLVLPAVFPPTFGVRVIETSSGPTLVAAVELVSPRNKDRDDSRRAFAAKCATYLQAGCGLIVVDVVTNRLSRPLADLMALLDPTREVPDTGPLAAVSYRPLRAGETDSLELRIRPLAVGGVLPELPLALNAGLVLPVDLEATYTEARDRNRL
jgi:hypothetical protein